MRIPRSHGATSQQPQLERPGGADNEYCGGTQQGREQEIETQRDTPMNPEKRSVSGVQILQNEYQDNHQGEDCDRNECP
jgi:hypothetical protein